MPSQINPKLIESLYNVTIDPDRYDELIAYWQGEFADIPDELNIENVEDINYQPKNLNSSVEKHFLRALTILDLIGDQSDKKATLKDVVNADPLPTFVMDSQGNIVITNAAFEAIRSQYFADNNGEVSFSENSQQLLPSILEKLEYAQEKVAMGIIQLSNSRENKLPDFELSKIHDPKTDNYYLYATALQTIWDDNKNAAIKALYKLTDSELDISKRLFTGDKTTEIAEDKHRSILTIRTQIRSIFKKTEVKTQSDLIKLFATIQNAVGLEQSQNSELENQADSQFNYVKQDHYIIRQNQRRVYYEIYGKPQGKPVLFLHGMISGTRMSQNIISELWKQNIKLICPHRAGFGYSDVNKNPDNLTGFVNDITALLDVEKIEKFPIIGHHDGGFYAYLLGNKLPERVEKIRNINACVPIITAKQLNDASPRQRITAYTALYTPKLLPFILRAGIAQVRKHGVQTMMDALFKDSAPDRKMLADPEIGDIMMNGFEACIANGIDSFVNDMRNVIGGNWSNLIDNCTMPIEIYHAKNEHVVPINQVYDMVKRLPQLELTELEGGQIILYKYPEIFFTNL